jgi:hypothetical protein
MVKRNAAVVVYKKSGLTWSTSGTILTDARDIIITMGIGKTKDTFSFRLTNTFNILFDGTSVIAEDDKVEIYLWSSFDTDVAFLDMTQAVRNNYLIIAGIVTQFSQDIGEERDVNIEGAGFADIMFKGLVFFKDAATVKKPHLVIKNVLNQLNAFNPEPRWIYWNDDNDILRRDGSAFPDIQYSSSYKTAIEVVEDMSSYQYTNDGAYYYNIVWNTSTSRFEFIWFAPENDGDNSTDITESTSTVSGDEIIAISMKQNKDKVVNAIIYNVGYDCTETPHEYLYFKPSDASSSNIQWKYMTETNTILVNLIQKECDANPTSWDLDTDGRRTSNFPNTYPYTITSFEDRNDDGDLTGAIVCDDGTEFNKAINKEGYWIGRKAAAAYTDIFGKSKWEGTITFNQTRSYVLGDLINLNLTSYNLTNKLVRLKGIKHTIDTTELELEEDAKSVILAGILSGGL